VVTVQVPVANKSISYLRSLSEHFFTRINADRQTLYHTSQMHMRVQNNAARIVLQAPRRSDVNSWFRTLHWLPVEQRINYKLAVLTLKT